jgi:uncharacterized protein (TIGR02001 family)
MKKITALLATVVASSSFSSADELSISSTFAWESDYVFRGFQLAEEYFAPSVDLSYGGFYAGIWAALPVDAQFGNEVDFYAGYGFGLSETVSADFGFTYYTYPDAADDFFDSDVNTFEIYAGLSFDMPFSPAVYVFYDFDAFDGALTIEASGGHSVEVSEEATVDFTVFIGYFDASDIYLGTNVDSHMYYGASAGYSYAFTDNASWSIGLNWYGSSEDSMAGGDDNTFSISTSFSAGF